MSITPVYDSVALIQLASSDHPSIIHRPGNSHVSSSPEDSPLRLEQNLQSPHISNAKAARYRDESDDQDIELASLSSATSGHEDGNSQLSSGEFLPRHIGPRIWVQRVFFILQRWVKGPLSPQRHRIAPILPHLQTVPICFLHRWLPRRKQRLWLLVVFCVSWMLAFLAFLSKSTYDCRIPGYRAPVRFSCVSRFWRSSTSCGIDGSGCRPFHGITFAFRCPADCRDTKIYVPETIGDTEYNYRSIVVGGTAAADNDTLPIYRGDSFICGAAIHAEILNNHDGGSGLASLTGEHSGFESLDANGISSLNFTPTFPLSFTFPEHPSGNAARCKDPRWVLLVLTMLSTATVSIFTTRPSVFFSATFISIYFCVALASDPPDAENFSDVISLAFRGFWPAGFVAFVIYQLCILYSLNQLDAHIEKTILWLGGCWIGALNNLTFDKLPLQRLTPHDLRQQPGAALTLVIIIFAVLAIAILQARAFRVEGRMPRYLAFYGSVGLLSLALMAVPNMNVRIHHFIMALLLIPGTSLQTRPSLLFQGILVGLFISGIARWGFDSILQTSVDLFGDDFGSPIPQISMPDISSSDHSITFSFRNITQDYNSMSVSVNDVERFRGSEDHDEDTFTWTRYKAEEPEYFRFAYVKYGLASEAIVGKFTNPGIWNTDGTWIPPKPKPLD